MKGKLGGQRTRYNEERLRWWTDSGCGEGYKYLRQQERDKWCYLAGTLSASDNVYTLISQSRYTFNAVP